MSTTGIDRLLVWWVGMACRHARLIVPAALAATGLFGHYAGKHLSVNSDTGSMISERLPWRRAFLDYERAFPELGDEIHLVIDGATPEAAEAAQRDLAHSLRARTDLFEIVFLPGGGPFFDRNGLLYRDPDELEELSRNVERFRDELLYLERAPTIRGLVDLLDRSMRGAHGGDLSTDDRPPDIRPILTLVGEAFRAQLERRAYQISWREVLSGRPSTPAERRRFIILNPRLDYTRRLPAGPALLHIRAAADSLGPSWSYRARVRISGSEAIEHEALESAMTSTRRAGTAALLGVGIILWLGLRSGRLLIAALITLIAGLAATAAFAAATVGSLNLISIAFAILYIGLGIDYSVHLCLGYVEALAKDNQHETALLLAAQSIGRSLVLSAVTTAACFYSFIPTGLSGVSELGLISGSGMFISLFATLTLLPALLCLEPLRIRSGARAIRLFEPGDHSISLVMHRFVRRRRRAILVTTAAAMLVGLSLLPRVRFDQNPLNLSDPDSESLTTYRDLVDQTGTVALAVSALAPSAERAREVAERLQRLDVVKAALTAEDLVPDEQPRKLEILEDIRTGLGPVQRRAAPDPPSNGSVEHTSQAVRDLRNGLSAYRKRLTGDDAIAVSRLRFLLRIWLRRLAGWPPETQELLAVRLEDSLVGSAAFNVEALRLSLEAQEFGLDDLPSDLRDRWISRDGAHRVQVIPKEKNDTSERLAHFVNSVRSEVPGLTGIPVNDLESGRIAVSAFRRAFTLAALATALLLVVLLRRPGPTALILGSLVVATVLTFAVSVLVDLPMNFANIITLPLILGVGVDNGIHVIHRVWFTRPSDDNLFATSTTRAVLFSTLTTMVSFGSLAVSSHQGLASMGRLLTIGMLALLLSTLLLLPALASRRGTPLAHGPPASELA